MTIYQFDYSYMLPEFGSIEMDLADDLNLEEAKELALREIKDTYPDITDIIIENVREDLV